MIQAPGPTTTTIAPPAFPASTTASVTHASVAVPTTTPLPGAAPGASSAGLIGAIISGAFLAAMLAGAVNVWMARRRSREEERARIRNTFAAAFEAYTAYKEFPYAIRRRRPNDPEAERIRLSEALRAVQEKLSYYLAWTQAESVEVGQQYGRLVAEARRVAGGAMHAAWNDPPRASDPEMNIPPEVVDLRQLGPPRPSTCRRCGTIWPA
jgi:acetylornithine deacetylase/succinyl-diaminopimelate desuccinylase-like protein